MIREPKFFAALLLLTGVSIVVSSVNRFPTAWRLVRRPKLSASRHYLRKQKAHLEVEVTGTAAEALERVVARWRANGLAPRVTERENVSGPAHNVDCSPPSRASE